MKDLKKEILFTLLFISIGIAVVTTNVIVNVSTPIANNSSDFLVYFSDVKVDGTQDLSLVKNEQKLEFNGEFSAIGDKKVISYDVTNASKDYDAEVTISCTESTNYLSINNSFDTDDVLSARSTKTGALTIELVAAVSEETSQEVTCTMSASAIERTSQGSGEVGGPLGFKYAIGREVSIGEEKFNLVSTTDDTVTLLAQLNISDTEPYKQTSSDVRRNFFDMNDNNYFSDQTEVDVQTSTGVVKTILNGYVDYLNSEYDVNVTGDLLTLAELGELGCTIPSDYTYGEGGWSCTSSENVDWLINGQAWWTRSIVVSEDSSGSSSLWRFEADGSFERIARAGGGSTRPLIIISKDEFDVIIAN